MPSRAIRAFLLGMALLMTPPPAAADEGRLLADLEGFFASDEVAERRRRVQAILANPSYDRARVGEWLHRLDLWQPFEEPPAAAEESAGESAGETSGVGTWLRQLWGRAVDDHGPSIRVDVGHGHRRRISLRLPPDYTPERPWPLIYALHPSGGSGPGFLARARELLGAAADRYILAAPTDYRQTVLDAPPPFTPEHPLMLRELRRRVHVDADRTYLLGYSLGGYTTWTLAMLHADQFAGGVALASAFSLPPDVAGITEAFAANFRQVPILHVWGTRDGLGLPGLEGRVPHVGTIASVNRAFSPKVAELGLDVLDRPIAGAGHGVSPPRDEMLAILGKRRVHYPTEVHHLYRHLHQGRAYWLEAHTWTGDGWGRPGRPIEPRQGESREQANARVILPLLGRLSGKIAAQTLRVETRHVGAMTVWLGDGMIAWDKPVVVEVDGRQVFAGEVAPDLAVCLSEAARTRDFDRLRWAGIRVEGGVGEPVTLETPADR